MKIKVNSFSKKQNNYALRRFSVGTASVLVGCSFLGQPIQVYGDTVTNDTSISVEQDTSDETTSTELSVSTTNQVEMIESENSSFVEDSINEEMPLVPSSSIENQEQVTIVNTEDRSASLSPSVSEETSVQSSSMLFRTIEETEKIDDRDERIQYGSAYRNWSDSSLYHSTEKYIDITKNPTLPASETTMNLTFTGTGVRIYGIKSNRLGSALVTIDGQTVDSLNFYHTNSTEKQVLIGEYTDLEAKEHTISIQVDPQSSTAFKKFSLDYFEIIKNTTYELNVLDFGADPSGKRDSTVAVRSALEIAKQLKGEKRIVFPQGQYDFYPDKASERELYVSNTVGADQNYKYKKIGILVEDTDNIKIDGSGSLFMFHGKMTTVAAINSKNVSFQNFSVDFKVPTVVDLYTESVSGNSVTYYVPEAYNYEVIGNDVIWKSDRSPYTNQYYWTEKNQIQYTQRYNATEGTNKRLGNVVFTNVETIEDLGNRRFKVSYGKVNQDILAGNSYQMRRTVRDHPGMFFLQSENIVLNDLNVHFLHGFGVVSQLSTNFTMNRTHFKAPEGSMRTTSGYADFVQVSGSKGQVLIENSSFSNPHDDAINIHGTYLQIVEKLSDTKIKVQYMHNETAGFPSFFVGDEVEFVASNDLIAVANSKRKIVAVEGPDGRSTPNNIKDLTQIVLTLDKALDASIQANSHVIENLTYTPSVIIRNNHFSAIPTRAILVSTRQPILIENNLFDRITMAAIFISDDAQSWYESGAVKDLTIRKNTFYAADTTQPILYILPTNPVVSTSKTVHQNIAIEDNHFYTYNSLLLYAKSVDGLKFINNRIDRFYPNINVSLSSPKASLSINETMNLVGAISSYRRNKELLSFNGSRNVEISGNSYDKGLNMALRYTNQSQSDFKGVDLPQFLFNENENLSDAIDDQGYIVSDSSVVYVSKWGQVRGLRAGQVTVKHYVDVNGSRYYSNPVTIEVLPTARLSLELLPQTQEIIRPVQLDFTSPSLADLTWTVENMDTSHPTTLANISSTGLLSPLGKGLVKVTLSLADGSKVSQLYLVNHTGLSFGEDWEVIRADSERLHLNREADKVTIRADRGTLWGSGLASNIILKTLSNAENVTVTVKLEGRPQASYDEAGLIFYKDDDNYVIANRKYGNGNKGIHLVNEVNRQVDEKAKVEEIDTDFIYFKLVKTGQLIEGFYSEDNHRWKKISSITNANLGTDFKVGIIAAGGNRTSTPFTFSEFTVNQEAVTFKESTVSLPSSQFTLEKIQDGAQVVFAEKSRQEETVYWLASYQENGPYQLLEGRSGTYLALTDDIVGKYVKAYLVSKGSSRFLSSSNIIYFAKQEDGRLDGSTKLSQISLNGSLRPIDTLSTNQLVKWSKETVDIELVAEREQATIELSLNGQVLRRQNGRISFARIALTTGLNEFVIGVTAEDGIHTDYYRIVLERLHSPSVQLNNLLVNGKTIDNFSADQVDYVYVTTKRQVSIKALTTDKQSKVYITTDRGRRLTNVETISLVRGTNRVVISVESPTGLTKYYEILVKVPDVTNTRLESIALGETIRLDQEFTSRQTYYTGWVIKDVSPMTFVADNPQALLTLSVNGKIFSAIGKLTANLPFYLGDNQILLTVSNGNYYKTQYRFVLRGQSSVDLTELSYQATSTTGWRAIQKNQSLNGEPISLIIDGERQYFDTGIAFHAIGKLDYDIRGKGFTRFEALLGIDGSRTKYSSLTFTVLVDGVEKLVTPELTVAGRRTQKISVDVTGATTVTILANDLGNNNSDHATIAQASFTTSLGKKSI